MSGKKTMWIAIGIGATCLALVVAVPAIIYTLVQSSVRSELETVKKAQANELTRLGWRVWNGQHSARATQAVWQDESGRTLTQATQFFQRAVELDPKNADAWNGLGWATFNSGNGQEGEKAFQKVLELEPEHPAALNGLGQIYLSQKKYVEAETYLLKAAPNAPAAWYGLARIHLLQGKFDQAREWAQKVVDSGQADDTAKQMLEAAKAKQLNPQLRMVLEPR